MVNEKSIWTGLKRGLARRCPNCGKGQLLRGYLTIRSPCEVCGNDNSAYPSDDFPPYLTIFVAGHVIVALFMWTDSVYEPPLWVEAAIWLPVTVLMCLALLPFMKGAAVGLCWAMNIVRQGVGDVTSREADLLVLEYQEINAHLRANTTEFVNWFSFFLTFSLVAAIASLVTGEHRQGLRGLALQYGVPIACLMLHVIALAGVLIFRHYVTAAHRKLDEIVKLLGDTGGSPVPVRFTLWMTHLMAAGFVVSYFAWFVLLLLPRD